MSQELSNQYLASIHSPKVEIIEKPIAKKEVVDIKPKPEAEAATPKAKGKKK